MLLKQPSLQTVILHLNSLVVYCKVCIFDGGNFDEIIINPL